MEVVTLGFLSKVVAFWVLLVTVLSVRLLRIMSLLQCYPRTALQPHR